MSADEEYRRQAAECRRMAENAINPDDKNAVAAGRLVAANVAQTGPSRELAEAERRRFKRIALRKVASLV
jgi:hypothetical protein